MFAANKVYGLISDYCVLFADFHITIKIIVFSKKTSFGCVLYNNILEQHLQ